LRQWSLRSAVAVVCFTMLVSFDAEFVDSLQHLAKQVHIDPKIGTRRGYRESRLEVHYPEIINKTFITFIHISL